MSRPELHLSSPVVLKRGAAWDGVRVEHFRFRAGQLPEHQHREHLLVVSMSRCVGEIRTANGFRARNEARGGVCVVPSGQPFASTLEGDTECLALYLEPSLVLRAASDMGYARGGVEVVARSTPHDPVVNRIGQALLAEMESEAPGGRLYAESLANVLAVHLLRYYTSTPSGARRFAGGLSGQRLRRVLAFIADKHEHEVSLEDLAGEAGMSTFHFAREFKRATGTTPHQHLIKYRVERAKALLAESEMPLVEVGLRSGFSHQSHFTRLFHKHTGTTPQSYRLMSQP